MHEMQAKRFCGRYDLTFYIFDSFKVNNNVLAFSSDL